MKHDLAKDLAPQLTTKETGDQVVEEGNFKNNDDVFVI